jgi:hypothetical protein
MSSLETVDNAVDDQRQFSLRLPQQLNPWLFGRDSSGFAMDLNDLGTYIVKFRAGKRGSPRLGPIGDAGAATRGENA